MAKGQFSLVDITGQRFGRLVALSEAGRRKPVERRWNVRCDCGTETIVLQRNLVSGWTKSCGCMGRERRAEATAKENQRRAADAAARNEAILAAGEKRCPHCDQVKELSEFSETRYEGTGRSRWCKLCVHDYGLRRKFGIGVNDKLNLILEQGGKCAVPDCGESIDITDAVDHCHESGQVRAVLCHPCNVSLGLLKENPRRIEGLARYARGWKQLRLAPVASAKAKP